MGALTVCPQRLVCPLGGLSFGDLMFPWSKLITGVVALGLCGFAIAFAVSGAEQHTAGLLTAGLGLVALLARSPLERQ